MKERFAAHVAVSTSSLFVHGRTRIRTRLPSNQSFVEKHIELDHQIDAAGGMSSAPQELKDAYWANQDELKAAYAHANEVSAP